MTVLESIVMHGIRYVTSSLVYRNVLFLLQKDIPLNSKNYPLGTPPSQSDSLIVLLMFLESKISLKFVTFSTELLLVTFIYTTKTLITIIQLHENHLRQTSHLYALLNIISG